MRIDLPNPDKFKHIFDMTLDEPLSEKVNGISTDSRDIKEGDLYLAISGEKVDGHSFLEEVFAKGRSRPIDGGDCRAGIRGAALGPNICAGRLEGQGF